MGSMQIFHTASYITGVFLICKLLLTHTQLCQETRWGISYTIT